MSDIFDVKLSTKAGKNKMTERTLKEIEKITKTKLTLGKLIFAIRQSDEISQVDFAEKLKITKQHLCDIEHERKSIGPKLAAKYAKILGYSKEQFIRLALQDLVDREGLNVEVEITLKGRKKHYHDSRIAA
jgi:transcriptional regulator with XRE-family HTH domain